MKKIILPILGVFLFLAFPVTAAHAQVFKMELANPSQTINVGDTVSVKILINTNNVSTINGDALITFDPSKVSIQGAQTGNFFTYFSNNALEGSSNKYLISSWEETIAHAKSSSTDTAFATFDVKALSAGSSVLSFECSAGTGADSNINQASDSADVINCASLTPLTLTIGSGNGTPSPTSTTLTSTPVPTTKPGSTTPTPTTKPATATPTKVPTSTPKPTATPKPTSTPRPTATPRPKAGPATPPGSTGMTIAAVGIGTLLTVIGILAIL
jgi:hypothetical protein